MRSMMYTYACAQSLVENKREKAIARRERRREKPKPKPYPNLMQWVVVTIITRCSDASTGSSRSASRSRRRT